MEKTLEHKNIDYKEKFGDRVLKDLSAFANTQGGTVVTDHGKRIIMGIGDNIKSAGILEPEFKEEMGGFSVYFRKDIYTEEYLRKLGLNERQIKAVMYVKEKGSITNQVFLQAIKREYRELVNTTKRTATRDLKNLTEKEILEQVGYTGKGTYYILKAHKGHKGDKGDIKETQRGQNE